MSDILKLNRLEYNILKCLHKNGCIDQYNSMTITELLEENKELLGVRMTVYRKLNKLNRAGYIKKGIIDDHADTFYLASKALKILEGKAPDTRSQYITKRNNILYDKNSVRNKLADIMDRGLMLKAIAVNAGLSESELSRFKNGVDALKESDIKTLAEYLDVLVIPRWNIEAEKSKYEKVESTRDWLFM